MIDGKKVLINSMHNEIKYDVAFVPEDRKLVSLNRVGSIKENKTIMNFKKYCVYCQVILKKKERKVI